MINHSSAAYEKSLESAFTMASMMKWLRNSEDFVPTIMPSQSLVNTFHPFVFALWLSIQNNADLAALWM
jgi:hypothetical protein